MLLRFVKRTAAVLLSVVCFAIIDAAVAHIPATPHVKISQARVTCVALVLALPLF